MEKRYNKSHGLKLHNAIGLMLLLAGAMLLAIGFKSAFAPAAVYTVSDEYSNESNSNDAVVMDTAIVASTDPQIEPTACHNTPDTYAEMVRCEMADFDVFYSSNNRLVPATICVPGGAGRCPLVVFLHGFCGDRDQGGGFSIIANELLAHGIASIRMDFCGCGENTQLFSDYCLSSMKEDVCAAIDFMTESYSIDCERIGLVAYSLGGRVALEAVAEQICFPYSMMLIAPAAETDGFVRLLGGNSVWQRMRSEAEINGFCHYDTYNIDLGIRFFEDFMRYNNPAQAAAASFSGKACVVYAKDDLAVDWSVSQGVADCLGCTTIVFSSGGHSTGLTQARDSEQMGLLVETAIGLFAQSVSVAAP